MQGNVMQRHARGLIGRKSAVVALAVLALSQVTAVYAEGEEDSSSTGHWYLGASTGYIEPDDDREAGNTTTVGVQGGYQFDKWSIDAGYQTSAGRYDYGTWSARTEIYDLNAIRHWGDKYRFLFEFGYSHVMMDSSGGDDAVAAFHIGVGGAAFVTDNLELRAVIKNVVSQNEDYEDYVATLSLNWHFGGGRSATVEESAAEDAGAAEEAQTIPPETVQEPVVAAAAAEPAIAPAAAAVVATDAAATPAAVPKSTHTLLNFNSDSLDIGSEAAKLDQISEEIKSSNASAVVEGHTDNVGSASSNKVLSLDRAIIVKRELKKRGVSSDKVRAVGMGEEQPVASNDTPEGRKQNRRVEVKVYSN